MSGAIAQLHARYRERSLTPREVVQATLQAAQTLGKELNAFTSLLPDAVREAQESTRRYHLGAPLSPLDGVPISVKDIIHVQGARTTAGSLAMDDAPAQQDAAVVAALRQAGAIVVGKTNLKEFAFGLTHPAFGAARNPWDLARTIGGSSSGSAAAVAAGIGLASIGTDTAGSVRNPAALGGVVGFKPTYASLSTQGVIPLSPSLDHVGILAQTVDDVRIVHLALSPHAEQAAKPQQLAVLQPEDLSPEVARLFGKTLERLAACGHSVQPLGDFPLDVAAAAAQVIIHTEALEVHRLNLAARWDSYGKDTRARISAAAAISGWEYRRALEVRAELQSLFAERMDGVDALLLPSLPSAAPLEAEVGTGALRSFTVFSAAFALIGVPALSVPIGCTQDTNMPVGMQVVGHLWEDGTVLRIAAKIEELRGTWPRPAASIAPLDA